MKILPSELCTDAEFLRRVYLDLTGLPPEPGEVRAFLADTRDPRAKRDELVDRLIGSPEFVEHWTNKWADLLQVNRKFLGGEGARAFRDWIREQVAANTPYDQFVRTILTASGSNRENPPAAYYKILRDAGGDDGEHHAPVPGRALQLQQVPRPSVRALDAGPVLSDRRLLRPGAACKPIRPATGRSIGGTAVEGAQAALRDRRRTGRRAR